MFFFNDTATTEIYTLSLHDALPISRSTARAGRATGRSSGGGLSGRRTTPYLPRGSRGVGVTHGQGDRKSTRLNSSHANISYAVFCLKKKKPNIKAVISSTRSALCAA